MNDNSRSISLAIRLMRSILALYPAEFRAEYEQDMLLTFQTRCLELRKHGGSIRLIGFFLTTNLDVLGEAAREHVESFVQSPMRGQQIGGLAWIVGGLLWAVLHTPLANGWLVIPIPTLILLILGLLSMCTLRAGGPANAALFVSVIGIISGLAGYLAVLPPLAEPIPHVEAARILTITGIILESGGVLGLACILVFRTSQQETWQFALLLLGIVKVIDAAWQLMPIAARSVLYSPLYAVGVAICGVVVGIGWMFTGAHLWRSAAHRTEVVIG